MDNVIEFENATEFFKKIRKLEAELSLYNALSKKAIETIKYYFSWENYAKTIYNHFIKDDL
jgi:glycosyltransferase involved in cell wall biosynthesis